MKSPVFLKSGLKRLTYSTFDLFRSLRLKKLIIWVAIAECRVLRSGFYSYIYSYCYQHEEFGLCDHLMEQYIPLLGRLPARRSGKQQEIQGASEDELKESMRKFFEATDAAGFKPFIAFGTLLGYAREKKFIPWDRDLDIGLFYDDTDIEALVRTLRKAGFIITEYTGKEFPCKIKCRLKAHPPVDIVFFKKEGEKLLTFGRLGNGSSIIRERSPFELTNATFYDVAVRIPEHPETFLTENYGDWKTPRNIYNYILDSKLTDYNSPGVRYLARTIFLRHLRENNRKAITYYLNLFIEKQPEDPIWAVIKKNLNEHKYLY